MNFSILVSLIDIAFFHRPAKNAITGLARIKSQMIPVIVPSMKVNAKYPYTALFNSDASLTHSGRVYLIEDGRYTAFTLIERRFSNKSLDEVQDIKEQQKSLVMECREDEIKSKIDLAVKIENLLGIAKKQMGSSATDNPSIKSIRQNRKKEQERNHFDVLEEAKHV